MHVGTVDVAISHIIARGQVISYSISPATSGHCRPSKLQMLQNTMRGLARSATKGLCNCSLVGGTRTATKLLGNQISTSSRCTSSRHPRLPQQTGALGRPSWTLPAAATSPARWYTPRCLTLGHARAVHTTCASLSGGATGGDAPKAALMVIGDEILSGSITDTNTPWLAKLLYNRGVDLLRVEYVSDTRDDIIDTVLRLKQRVGPQGLVFTSGGIGPTHDDVTYEALATAFGVQLQLHEPTVERMRESYAARGMELNAARLRMATLPTPAEVLFTPGLWVPLVNLQGVYILPGIPKLFQGMISAHQERFTGTAHSSVALFSQKGESILADALTGVAAQHPKVHIGSYPNTNDADTAYKVKLQFNSRDQVALQEAVAAAKLAMPFLLERG